MYCQIKISATDKKEATEISRSLVEKKLVAGTMITKGNCHYWWDNEVVEKEYYNINAFSLIKNKDAIIEYINNMHKDECPIISFVNVDGNKEFLEWIEEFVM